MQVDFSDGKGNVYRTNANGTYFVKLNFKSSGLHINRMRVIASRDDPGEYIAYPPSYLVKRSWKSDFEFNRSAPLWQIIEDLAIKAVKAHEEQEEIDIDNPNFEDDLSRAFDSLDTNSHPP